MLIAHVATINTVLYSTVPQTFFMFNCRRTAWCFLSWHPQSFTYSMYASRLYVALVFSKSHQQRFRPGSMCLSLTGRTLASITTSSRHTPSAFRHSGVGSWTRRRRWRVACCLQVLLVWSMKRSSVSFSLCFSGKISIITIPHLKTRSPDWFWRAWPTTSGVQFSLSKLQTLTFEISQING